MNKALCAISGCINEGRYCRIPGHIDVQVKAKKPIAQFSPKREEINRKQYGPAQKAFLKENPFCKLKRIGCTKMAEGVHHMDGKENIEKLLNQKRWLPACNHCNREVERLDQEARESGLKGSKHIPNYERIK